MKIIRYAQHNPTSTYMKETTARLSMVCDNVKSISQATTTMKMMTE